MFRIDNRLNDIIDMENDRELAQRCEKQMELYEVSDRPEFTDLTEEQLAQVDEFWEPYESIYKMDPFVTRYYTNVTGRFDPRYIPEDLQKYLMSRYFMDQDYVEAFKDKNFTEVILADLAAPKTLIHKIAGTFLNGAYEPITEDEAVDIILEHKKASEGPVVAVIKPTMSTSGGSGLVTIGRYTTKNEIRQMLTSWRPDVVVQEVIKQHPDLAAIHPESVNSIRVMSLLKNGKCRIVSACLRVGAGGSFADNMGRGGMSCGIRPDGTCRAPFYDKHGVRYDKHPGGFEPEGFHVPGFDELISTIKTHHVRFPQLRLISWDFAIDEGAHPVFIEWNMKGDTQLHQYGNGPLYGEDTREILDEFFAHTYKETEQGGIIYREYINHAEAAGCGDSITELVIAGTINGKPVTAITGRAFFQNERIVSLRIDEGVKSIGYQAFFGCRSLKEIKLPQSLETIGEAAFSYCSELTSIKTSGSGLKEICPKAFMACRALTAAEFGDGLTKLNYRSFSGCALLESFTAGNGLKRIEERCFQGCKSLKAFETTAPKVTVLARAFLNCSGFDCTSLIGRCGFIGLHSFKGCIGEPQEEK